MGLSVRTYNGRAGKQRGIGSIERPARTEPPLECIETIRYEPLKEWQTAPMAEDYYQTLGLARDASQSDIDTAYRNLARKHHPDLNPDDKRAKEKFQQVQNAYDVLKDPEKRQMFDRYGSGFENMGGGQAHSGGFDDFAQMFGGQGGGGNAGFEDLFRQFAGAGDGGRGRGRRAQPPRRGRDIEHEIQVSLKTAIEGGETELRLQRADGAMESITAKIPAGIENRKKIRLRGKGEAGAHGGPAGDILIRIAVASDPVFQRLGDDLIVKTPVTVGEAALGAKIDVPTPRGEITLTVPPGSSSGTRLRAKGQGVTSAAGKTGDLYAELKILLPKEIDERSAELLQEFQDRNAESPRENLKW